MYTKHVIAALQMSLLKVSVWFTVITPLFLCYETILITVHMSHFTPWVTRCYWTQAFESVPYSIQHSLHGEQSVQYAIESVTESWKI